MSVTPCPAPPCPACPASQGHTIEEALAWAASEGALPAEIRALVERAVASRSTPLRGEAGRGGGRVVGVSGLGVWEFGGWGEEAGRSRRHGRVKSDGSLAAVMNPSDGGCGLARGACCFALLPNQHVGSLTPTPCSTYPCRADLRARAVHAGAATVGGGGGSGGGGVCVRVRVVCVCASGVRVGRLFKTVAVSLKRTSCKHTVKHLT